jgi:beta-lactam-binding protein with PASTA domain
MAAKKAQRGISFITVLFIVGMLAALGVMLMQAFPSFLEYQSALKAINKAKEAGTVAEIRKSFDRAAEIDNITSLTGKDLTIAKNGDQVEVSFAYDKEFHMFGPAYLLLKYQGTSKPGR